MLEEIEEEDEEEEVVELVEEVMLITGEEDHNFIHVEIYYLIINKFKKFFSPKIYLLFCCFFSISTSLECTLSHFERRLLILLLTIALF